MRHILTVRMLDAPYRADRDYDYLCPPEQTAAAERDGVPLVGRIAIVPFGRGNRAAFAVVTAARTGESERTLKAISSLLPPDFRVREEILSLCFFLREHTLCSIGEAVRAAMPTAALGLLCERYEPTDAAMPPAAPRTKEDEVLVALSEGKGDLASLEALFGKGVRRTLLSLTSKGLVRRQTHLRAEARTLTERTYRIAAAPEEARTILEDGRTLRSDAQRTVYRFLADNGECTEDEITDRLNLSLSPLRTLTGRGLLVMTEREVERNPYAALSARRDTSPVLLSRAQEEAYLSLRSLYDRHTAACALLHGVTGSGKTRVMMRLLDDVLAEGRGAILLVPEIALTPQTVGIFCSRYGERVSVLHSSLSVGERHDAYRKIMRGDADLVIGTRSAVFAPLPHLGLIIIDEEHEHTYKSDANPRYHTKEVAAFRSGQVGGLTVLASATPSLESFYKAQTGAYTLVSLTERYGGAMLPATEIVDMREELREGNTSPVSRRLAELLTQAAGDGKQSILFLNRRGYHHSVLCRACGEPLTCPHCSVSLTYHTDYHGAHLLCHACGGKSEMPRVCPACGGDALSFVGARTQKPVAEISTLADGLRVLRMDADTTGSKSAYGRLLGAFRRGEAEVLLGTQMVTKGHDFPRVALSGVLLADTSLYMNDFRAAERTFSLLTQVIGRAGRAGEPGYALVQTFSPEHKVIRLAAAQDYIGFYEEEIALRRALHYPPFADIAEVFLSGTDEQAVLTAAGKVKDRLIRLFREEAADLPAEIYGPLEPQTYRVAERYRMKLLIKCRLLRRVRALFGRLLEDGSLYSGDLTLSVDFNPSDT